MEIIKVNNRQDTRKRGSRQGAGERKSCSKQWPADVSSLNSTQTMADEAGKGFQKKHI
jgi:hypothetical protein